MKFALNKYHLMTFTAFVLAVFSSVMTALGMSDLFEKGGIIIFLIFMCIDLGRFLLFNFLTDEWKNLRKIKYIIALILALLFGYSAVGIFSQLSNMISPETRQAMLNAATYNKAAANALVKQTRTSDMTTVAKKEYEEALSWNKTDYTNCLKRAQTKETQEEIDKAENKCNNTKRWLDNKASKAYKEAMSKADESLDKVEATTKDISKNQSDLAAILTSICEIGRMDCGSYQGLQNALSIVIILVIIGTDYLQIAIVLAVNTRKNKKENEDSHNDDPDDPKPSTKNKKVKKSTVVTPKDVAKKPKKKTETKDTETLVLSKKASKKLAKRLLEKPKPNASLKNAMKDYEKSVEQEELVKETKNKSSEKSKKPVKSATKKKKVVKEQISPKEEQKTVEEKIKLENDVTKTDSVSTIVMSDAQRKEIERLKRNKKTDLLGKAFDAAVSRIKKSSKNNKHSAEPFSRETDFM